VGVLERLENLGADLDCAPVVDLAVAQRLAQGLSGHMLVGDVDVLIVVAEIERA
jgi:riboflavin synthase alpha subunit